MKINKNYFIALLIFVIVMLLVGLFGGCCPVPQERNVVDAQGTKEQIYLDNGCVVVDVYKVKYNGHDYIMFKSYHQLGAVHDPDCEKCKQNSNNSYV